jgi:hypothetical protein
LSRATDYLLTRAEGITGGKVVGDGLSHLASG